MEEFETKIKLTGTVTDITFYNDANGYTVFYVDIGDEELTVVGNTMDVQIGDRVELVGEYTYHSLYGRQFKAESCNATLPETVDDLYHYLASGVVKGVRESTALKIIDKFGADTLRLYEMFMGPIEASKPWSAAGVDGARKFVDRVWRFFTNMDNITENNDGTLDKAYNSMVKRVTNDFETLGFNTAISQFMIFVNECYKVGKCPKEYAEGFVKLLNPVAPHIGEELWEKLGNKKSIAYETWPTYNEEFLKDDPQREDILNGNKRFDSVSARKIFEII